MAQAPLTTAKMFTASWTEHDEAVLIDLLKRKIAELRYEIKECDSPYARARLKARRKQYKELLDKVERSDYDPNILAQELKSHNLYNTAERNKREKRLGKYADSYADVNFDFDAYFGRTRYFGALCPLISLILIIAFLGILLSSAFISTDTLSNIELSLSTDDTYMSLSSIGYIKLEPGVLDFKIPNDGDWPKGIYEYVEYELVEGEKFHYDDYTEPEYVYLCEDLGMVAIDITVFDVVKALFRTPMLSEDRIDIIENLDSMQGRSWYYLRFMRDRSDDIKIEKDENGEYDSLKIVKHIATYGTIVFLCLTIILCVIEILINIGRLFSYTSRRVHVIPLFILICGILTLLCPAFLEITELSSEGVSTALTNYFTTDFYAFRQAEGVNIIFNMMFPILLILPFITILLPFFFRNRPAQTVAYVPKGNKRHTYAGNTKPTKAGQPGDPNAERKTKGKIAKAGSRSPSSGKYPAR